MSRGHHSDALRGAARVNGIAVLIVLVVAGMGITGVYYHYKAPKILAQMRREQGAMPATAEGRVTRWLDFGSAFIHQRLLQLRFSARQPWLVTHTVAAVQDSPEQEIWGVDFTELAPAWTSQRGLEVVVSLPAAKLLGHGPLVGDMALNVPRHKPGDAIADPNQRARGIAEWSLELLAKALAKDIDGARLVVVVGGDSSPPASQPSTPPGSQPASPPTSPPGPTK